MIWSFLVQKTQLDLDKMTEEHSRLQQKLDASKARNKVLANEVKSVKAQIKTLLEKGAHDDELIAALMVIHVIGLSLSFYQLFSRGWGLILKVNLVVRREV